MNSKIHTYHTLLTWKSSKDSTTHSYKTYSRNHELSVRNKPIIYASADSSFRGDIKRYNPEEFLVMSISSCHMLWYLHLCSNRSIFVQSYTDSALGIMKEHENGSGSFSQITLNINVSIKNEKNKSLAKELHHEAHKFCFIANSLNFPVIVISKENIVK